MYLIGVMTRLFRFPSLAALALACLIPASALAQAVRYDVTEIPNAQNITHPPTVMSINNAGQIVGYYRWTTTSGRGGSRTNFLGWMYERGNATQIGPSNFEPVKINNNGVIAGNITLGAHPAILANGVVTTLSTSIGQVTDIDDNDNVIGYMGGGAQAYYAVEWTNQVMTQLAPTAWMSTATAIGDNLIAGSIEANAGSGVWYFGGDINNPNFIMTQDAFYDTISSISSRGTAVGWHEDRIVGGGTYYYAVQYKNGVLTQLDRTSSNGLSWANGVNSHDVIVGAKFGHATRWFMGTEVDLNNLIPRNSGWTLVEANAINDSGVIVGMGTYNGVTRPFILTPSRPISITAGG